MSNIEALRKLKQTRSLADNNLFGGPAELIPEPVDIEPEADLASKDTGNAEPLDKDAGSTLCEFRMIGNL